MSAYIVTSRGDRLTYDGWGTGPAVMNQAADAIVTAVPGASQRRSPGAAHSRDHAPMAAEHARFVSSRPRDEAAMQFRRG